jgi:tetratricopeptide (TPR) repeat protein
MGHNKEKPIPFASAPVKQHRTSQNQAFKFYLKMLQNKENTKPLDVNELFVIIREVKTPTFEASDYFMETLDKIFLMLESNQFELCQAGLNSLILKTETSDKSLSKETTEKVSYLSYLKALLFDLDGDFQKSLYFFNEALLKLRKYPEKGNSSNVYYGMGCLFFNNKKIDLACKCFLKAKNLRDQYTQDEQINLGNSSHHSSFLLNNIACCLVHFSNQHISVNF